MDIWSYAVQSLGLSSECFYSLTPVQLGRLARRHADKKEYNEFLLAQLGAYMVNTSFRAPEKPMSIEAFMPSARRGQRKESKTGKALDQRRIDGQRMYDWIQSLKKDGAFKLAK